MLFRKDSKEDVGEVKREKIRVRVVSEPQPFLQFEDGISVVGVLVVVEPLNGPDSLKGTLCVLDVTRKPSAKIVKDEVLEAYHVGSQHKSLWGLFALK